MLSAFLLFPRCNCFSSFLRLLTGRFSSNCNKSAMTSRVCVLQNVSLHSVCIVCFLRLFSRSLSSPTQSPLICLLAEYLSDAWLNKPLTVVCGGFQHLRAQTVFWLFFSYHFLFHNLPVGIVVLCKSCDGKEVLSQRKILIYLEQVK